jgi:hypothetical protein
VVHFISDSNVVMGCVIQPSQFIYLGTARL